MANITNSHGITVYWTDSPAETPAETPDAVDFDVFTEVKDHFKRWKF